MNFKPLKTMLIANEHTIIVSILTLIFAVTLIILSFSLHDGLKTSMNDTGNVTQPLFNTMKGNFMATSNNVAAEYFGTMNRFGRHANFILLLFLPIFTLFPTPKLLFFVQILLVSLGVIPLFKLSKSLLNESTFIVVPLLFLINPLLHDTLLYEFHAITLTIPAVFLSFYALHFKKSKTFIVSLVFIALLKEDAPLIPFMFGLYLLYKKDYKRGILVAIVSLIYFLLINLTIMPALNPNGAVALVQNRYGHLGIGISGIIKNIFTQPQLMLGPIFSQSTIIYLLLLLFPLAFLPIISPLVFLLSTPSLLINILSSNPSMKSPFYYYYQAPILPFLFIATLFSLYKLKGKSKKLYTIALLLVTTVSLSMSIVFSPIPYSLTSKQSDYEVTSHAKEIKYIKSIIPQTASLSVQNNLGGHFSNREYIYTFPYLANEAEYVLVDISDPHANIQYFPRQKNFIHSTQLTVSEYKQKIDNLFSNPNYSVEYFTHDGYVLFTRDENKTLNIKARTMFENKIKILEERYRTVTINQTS